MKTVLFSNVWFDNDWHVPAAHAQALTATEATEHYLDTLACWDLPVPAVPYNPLTDTVEIANPRDPEAHQVYLFSPISTGGLQYFIPEQAPEFGWRVTINNKVVYEAQAEPATA